MLAFIMALLSSSSVFAAGFSAGSEFQATPISGRLTYICHEQRGREGDGRSSYQNLICEDNILEPYDMDYFIPDSNDLSLKIDKVEISRLRKNGKTTKQSRNYLAKDARSRHFNLWVSTLTQRPLLDIGSNVLKYKLIQKRKTVKEGEFTVNVTEGEALECLPDHITEWGNCNAYAACQTYFRRQNYCR